MLTRPVPNSLHMDARALAKGVVNMADNIRIPNVFLDSHLPVEGSMIYFGDHLFF
jgi:hypothetical protein